MAAGGHQLLQHHPPFGDEQALAAREIALADRSIGLDPRIAWIGDLGDHQTRTRFSGGRASFCVGWTPKAAYHASMLRTVWARYMPGACTSVSRARRRAASRYFDR